MPAKFNALSSFSGEISVFFSWPLFARFRRTFHLCSTCAASMAFCRTPGWDNI